MSIEIAEQSGAAPLIGNQSQVPGSGLAPTSIAAPSDTGGGGPRAIVSAPLCEAILDFDGNQIWPNPELPPLGGGGLFNG